MEHETLAPEAAEVRKAEFVKLVGKIAELRDLQYANDFAPMVIEAAERVVALNLPSNLLRAAIIFVDFRFGFPPNKVAFVAPEWVESKKLLPAERRGSLVCSFNDRPDFSEKETVVLISDMPQLGLHAGMAGVVREMPSEDEGDDIYLIEFGEPYDCNTVKAEIDAKLIRRPRPGDWVENYRE